MGSGTRKSLSAAQELGKIDRIDYQEKARRTSVGPVVQRDGDIVASPRLLTAPRLGGARLGASVLQCHSGCLPVAVSHGVQQTERRDAEPKSLLTPDGATGSGAAGPWICTPTLPSGLMRLSFDAFGISTPTFNV